MHLGIAHIPTPNHINLLEDVVSFRDLRALMSLVSIRAINEM